MTILKGLFPSRVCSTEWRFPFKALFLPRARSSDRLITPSARRPSAVMGVKADKSAGGLVLSLGMSMASDIVPRHRIRSALLEAQVCEAEVALILEWLKDSAYHIRHGQHHVCVTFEKGVRQGCVLSPLIWTCFTCCAIKSW